MARTVAMRKRFRSTDWSKAQNKKARTISIVPRNKFGFSEVNRTNLRYVENYLLLANATNTTISQQMRMNGIFDPDATGGGHQPMWRDNFASVYENYRVISARIKVTFIPSPTSDSGLLGPYVIGIVGAAASTNPSTLATTRQEMSDSTYKTISRYTEDNKLYLTYTPKGKLGAQWNDDTVSALVGSNPSQQYFANVWFSDMSAGANSYMYATVEVDYVVEFFKLTLQTQN